MFVCPSMRLTFSIFASFDSIHVANECRAMCECNFSIPITMPMAFSIWLYR